MKNKNNKSLPAPDIQFWKLKKSISTQVLLWGVSKETNKENNVFKDALGVKGLGFKSSKLTL